MLKPLFFLGWGAYAPMHDAAPSAVTIAVAIDAIICTINLIVSFLLITQFFNFKILQFFHLFNFKLGGALAPTLSRR